VAGECKIRLTTPTYWSKTGTSDRKGRCRRMIRQTPARDSSWGGRKFAAMHMCQSD